MFNKLISYVCHAYSFVLRRVKCIKALCEKTYFSFVTKYNNDNYKTIPIIINNFNRFECLKSLIDSLEKRGYTNIIIIDNNSTYPPLLKYYEKECKYEVVRLKKNYGHTALWTSGIIKRFNCDYFIYTDPDLVFIDECPEDVVKFMLAILRKHPRIDKIAVSLRISDIPDDYPLKEMVVNNESRFWSKMKYGCYIADVDTTFALLTPKASAAYHEDDFSLRTPEPYVMRHLPWYEIEESEETKYYKKHKIKEVGWWIN